MAKSPKRKLKVFQARLGFYDTVVAAPSQAAALRAWGTSQNLFANGEAKPTTNQEAVAAATRYPETVLRRAIGSKDAFALKPTSLPTLPDEPRTKKGAPKRKGAAVVLKPPDRSGLAAAEKELRSLDESHKQKEARLQQQISRLEAQRESAQNEYLAERKVVTARVVSERAAYRKAGGSD